MTNFITQFVEIILPLPIRGSFTYRIPQTLLIKAQVGRRAVVQFGKSKVYSGIISEIHDKIPEKYEVKYILDIIDDEPVVNQKQLEFWKWISDYYMCHLGDVMQAALPSALKLSSETVICIHPDFDGDISSLNPKELLIADACSNQEKICISDISKIIEVQKIMPIIKNLIQKKVIQVNEQLTDLYKPKIVKYISLSLQYQNSELQLKELLDELSKSKRAFKQMMLLMNFLRLSNGNLNEKIEEKELLLTPEISKSSFKTVVEKGILEINEQIISRLDSTKVSTVSVNSINYSDAQKNAIADIEQHFVEKNASLLFGVTGSGKTEIYIHFINQAIQRGEQVLFLLPEIALTSQIVNRLRSFFGAKVGVYHSKFSEFEKVEIWNAVQNKQKDVLNQYSIILGARSSVFLPFSKLGLIIVDEEHDTSYKQFDPSPRYHARDSALYLAQMHNAKTLLGSATPSIESYYQAVQGKFGLHILKERFGEAILPKVILVDLKDQFQKKLMKSHYSSVLINHISDALSRNEQVILFQNRRGFSSRIECEDCHYVVPCKSCDVTLTYHKKNNILKCHYCGYSIEVPKSCPVCGSIKLNTKGFGTEKIESDLEILFPNARVARMDYDTTRSKNSYQQIIQDFENHEIDILVGTQMVTKGLDFDSVSVVGIINADNMINFPDFRSFERSFQQMAQVSGRAGRKNIPGKVIIQSYNPEHNVFDLVKNNQFEEMFKLQMEERKSFSYPPFIRMIRISVKHVDFNVVNKASEKLARMIESATLLKVIGPEFPLIGRIKNLYLKDILVKLPKSSRQAMLKQVINNTIEQFETISDFKSCRISKDVDPY